MLMTAENCKIVKKTKSMYVFVEIDSEIKSVII